MRPSSSLLQLLAREIGQNGPLRFDRFVEQALYHPAFGYYCQPVRRVGRRENSDFYTASSIDSVFGPLVAAAAESLLPLPAEECAFIEIGAEPEGGILSDSGHPFAEYRILRRGEAFTGCDRPCVIFSNELFDAQPFRRFLYRDGQWHEQHVGIAGAQLAGEWIPLATTDPLPFPAVEPGMEGYQIDWPSGAGQLGRALAEKAWQGLWLAFDYGLSQQVLLEERPEGTARSYRRHRQANELLADPGERDLTCHICWDALETMLEENGFRDIQLQSQEAFFMHHATAYIEKVLTDAAGHFSRQRQSLKELLHPHHMGNRFQVLSALRPLPTSTDSST